MQDLSGKSSGKPLYFEQDGLHFLLDRLPRPRCLGCLNNTLKCDIIACKGAFSHKKGKVHPMGNPKEIYLDGSSYVWNGKRWYQAKTFLTPPVVTIMKLDLLLLRALEEEDLSISDIDELLDRARQAQNGLQYERSEAILRRILKQNPRNPAAMTLLCSTLRALDRPMESLKATNGIKGIEYAPLLVARAAAFCDLGKLPEATAELTRAIEIGGDESAPLVAKRIKSQRRSAKLNAGKKA